MYDRNFYLIEEEEIDKCICCGEPCFKKWCRKYNGFIGKCPACDSSWRES